MGFGMRRGAIAFLFNCQSVILSQESVPGVFKTYPRFGIGVVDQVFLARKKPNPQL